MGAAQYFLSDASKYPTAQPTPSMSGQHDDVHLLLLGKLYDLLRRPAKGHRDPREGPAVTKAPGPPETVSLPLDLAPRPAPAPGM